MSDRDPCAEDGASASCPGIDGQADSLVAIADGDLLDREANRAFAEGTMTAALLHEMANPFSNVLISLRMAHEDLKSLHEELLRVSAHDGSVAGWHAIIEQTSAVRETLGDAVVAAELVRDALRKCQRVARGDLHFSCESPRRADIRPYVQTAVKLVNRVLESRAKLVVKLDPVPAVQVVPRLLSQVVVNLLLNAADAIPAGSPQEHEVRVETTESDGSAVLDVSDTGHGIPTEILPRVFEPFFTTKPAGAGGGLGLFVSRTIVESFRGTLTVQSTPGEGSAFRIRIPAG